jgi:hypothetical protein
VLCEILGGYCIVEASGVLDESGPICTILLPLWESKARFSVGAMLRIWG